MSREKAKRTSREHLRLGVRAKDREHDGSHLKVIKVTPLCQSFHLQESTNQLLVIKKLSTQIVRQNPYVHCRLFFSKNEDQQPTRTCKPHHVRVVKPKQCTY